MYGGAHFATLAMMNDEQSEIQACLTRVCFRRFERRPPLRVGLLDKEPAQYGVNRVRLGRCLFRPRAPRLRRQRVERCLLHGVVEFRIDEESVTCSVATRADALAAEG